MAVFICETCGATLKKQQVDKHCNTVCRNAWNFTCVECIKTFEGYDYKDHNECMTEVQKFQGKFLDKQRQQKQHAKTEKKLEKEEKKIKEESKDQSDNEGSSLRSKISKDETKQLRKHLEDGCEWQGLAKTVKSILERENDKKPMKVKKVSKIIHKVFLVSEDYDSDESEQEEDLKFLLNEKKIRKALKKDSKLKYDEDKKTIALAPK